jgi:hypothetical protein
MGHIRVATIIDAPPTRVWSLLRDVGGHVAWMHDAVAIRFTSPGREGVGTTFDCLTRVGPIRLNDRMEITEWVDERCMGGRHVGLVRGTGRFALRPVGHHRTQFTWDERLEYPWWIGGRLGGLVGDRVLRAIWRRNLVALKQLVERG